jgi:hypothetical protein
MAAPKLNHLTGHNHHCSLGVHQSPMDGEPDRVWRATIPGSMKASRDRTVRRRSGPSVLGGTGRSGLNDAEYCPIGQYLVSLRHAH